MVATRSSPRKKHIVRIEREADPEPDLDLEEDAAPEDATIKIDEAEVKGKGLAPADNNPPKLFILPKDASKEARIITLPEPSSGVPGRYFACPEKGIFEFTRVGVPKSEPRSVLIAPAHDGEEQGQDVENNSGIAKGYVAESPDLFVATPVDPVFLLVPILAPVSNKNQKRLFVTFDDHMESATPTFRHILKHERLRESFEARLKDVCDTVEAGDESLYRLSSEKLATVLVAKARRMVKHGLPVSMEEKFIRQALQAPLLSIKREDTVTSQVTTTEDAEAGASVADSQTTAVSTPQESQSSISQISRTTSMTSVTISQDADILPDAPPQAHEATEEVKDLLRLRTALSYITTCYIPPHISTTLTYPSIDFSPLDTHLKYLASLHEEARALRSLSDNITRKRGHDDDEAAEERAEKKRKKEEDEKRKKSESNATKQLKKVNTTGMKKMSSFFTKVPKKA